MAVTFDHATDGGIGAGSTMTFSHTCTGSSLVLILYIITYGSTVDPSAVTYNGSAMTKLNNVIENGSKGSIWYLIGPPTGSNIVSVTVGAGVQTSMLAASFAGANNVNGFQSNASAGAASTSITITSRIVDMITDCAGWLSGGITFTATSGQTVALTEVNRSVVGYQPGSASVVESWSMNTSNFFLQMGCNIVSPINILTKTASASVSNSASRFATVAKQRISITKLMASVSNAASRFATVARRFNGTRKLSATVTNAASRFVVLKSLAIRGWQGISKPTNALFNKITKPTNALFNKIAKPASSLWNKITKP